MDTKDRRKTSNEIVPIDSGDDLFPNEKRGRGLWAYEQIKSETPFQRVAALLLGCVLITIGGAGSYAIWSRWAAYDGVLALILAMVIPVGLLAWGFLAVHSPLIYYYVCRLMEHRKGGRPN